MSTQQTKSGMGRRGGGRAERFIQPSILLRLKQNPSYGYEILRGLEAFGFVEGAAPPGMIYRHLRELEAAGLVTSAWQTVDAGPARRVYELTAEGAEALDLWVRHMEAQARKLVDFVKAYRQASKPAARPRPRRQRAAGG